MMQNWLPSVIARIHKFLIFQKRSLPCEKHQTEKISFYPIPYVDSFGYNNFFIPKGASHTLTESWDVNSMKNIAARWASFNATQLSASL